MRLAESAKKFMTEATEQYAAALEGSEAVSSYLEGRGISLSVAATFRLGAVSDPLPGHEMMRGMLSVPYLTETGTVAMKFRRIQGEGPKYLGLEGQGVRLYNVSALWSPLPYIVICEGELDCVSASSCGVNAVGVPGVGSWRDHYPACLEGFADVFILTDNDDKADGSNPGQDFARRIIEDIPHARNVLLPKGNDVNEFVVNKGSDALRQLLGIEATIPT